MSELVKLPQQGDEIEGALKRDVERCLRAYLELNQEYLAFKYEDQSSYCNDTETKPKQVAPSSCSTLEDTARSEIRKDP